MKTEKLKFALGIRVSTEAQEKKGISPKRQLEVLISDVKKLGGKVVKIYEGSEHATPDHPRPLMEEILADSAKGIFDAVIFYDSSRWSRDQDQNKANLRILQDNRIRFFIGLKEYYLDNPDDILILGISASVNEHQAESTTKRILLDKIQAAKQGKHVRGTLPRFRRYKLDENGNNTGYLEVDPEKREQMEWAADQFLEKGRSLSAIGRELGHEGSWLQRAFRQSCSDHYYQTFNVKRFNIKEKIKTPCGRILPEETIKAINMKLDSNQDIVAKRIKHDYPLSRLVICGECGIGFTGDGHRGFKQYRHRKSPNHKCQHKSYRIKAIDLEDSVMFTLWTELRNKRKLEAAFKAAIPKHEEIKKKKDQFIRYKSDINKARNAIANIVKSIGNETITDEEAAPILKEHRHTIKTLSELMESLENELVLYPDEAQMKMQAGLRARMLINYMKSYARLEDMSYREKRDFLKKIFTGKDPSGERYGVYIHKNGRNKYRYTVKGNIPHEIIGLVPLEDDLKAAMAGLEEGMSYSEMYKQPSTSDGVCRYFRKFKVKFLIFNLFIYHTDTISVVLKTKPHSSSNEVLCKKLLRKIKGYYQERWLRQYQFSW